MESAPKTIFPSQYSPKPLVPSSVPPFKFRVLVMTPSAVRSIQSFAPLATVMAPDPNVVFDRLPAPPNKVPALTVDPPEYVFIADKVNAPVPALTIDPVPEIIPLSTWFVLDE